MSNEENFHRQFTIGSFFGNPDILAEEIKNQVTGVRLVTPRTHQYVNDTDIDVEIEYNPIKTDIDQIALDIEKFESVEGEVTSS